MSRVVSVSKLGTMALPKWHIKLTTTHSTCPMSHFNDAYYIAIIIVVAVCILSCPSNPDSFLSDTQLSFTLERRKMKELLYLVSKWSLRRAQKSCFLFQDGFERW